MAAVESLGNNLPPLSDHLAEINSAIEHGAKAETTRILRLIDMLEEAAFLLVKDKSQSTAASN